ncbi:matrix metalloproteinase-28 [Erpetoichthys calabaricus]|uniref:matrix metalloproteinase-28 n=1 Tax=Erpetoichthys calabaricus TaxID=27687 RepID=UPI0022349B91|nr:matrix metalloproteinase-28 [Erpetoichthys calabaricus]
MRFIFNFFRIANLLLLLAAVFIAACASVTVTKDQGFDWTKIEGFLEKYGYLEHEKTLSHDPPEIRDAVREFQWLSHLPTTGSLDMTTVHQMSEPRCGVTDRKSHKAWQDRIRRLFLGGQHGLQRTKRYTNQGEKWYKRHLTYKIVNWPKSLSEAQVKLAVKVAFELWSNVSALAFWEVDEGPADIRLAFYDGEHNDGSSNAFDGPGGALAHAFFPRRGEAHFDITERWTLNSLKGRNLFIVTAHEIGHTLGLEHSPVKNALMSPYYKKLGKDFVLSWDDIMAVQQMYGKPSNGSPVQLSGRMFASFLDSVYNNDLQSSEIEQSAEDLAPYCQTFFDAITMDMNHTVYIFKDGLYWTVSPEGEVSSPQYLQKRWPGLPPAIEAVSVSKADGKIYFFKGGRCWRFDGENLDEQFPQKNGIIGLPRHPDSAFHFQPLGHMVVLKGPRYFVFNEEALRVEPYYPRGLSDWKGVPINTNGVLTRPDGLLYFFKDDRFWKFDPVKLKVISSGQWAQELGWTGCKMRREEVSSNAIN